MKGTTVRLNGDLTRLSSLMCPLDSRSESPGALHGFVQADPAGREHRASGAPWLSPSKVGSSVLSQTVATDFP
jgi:hypothetical protein